MGHPWSSLTQHFREEVPEPQKWEETSHGHQRLSDEATGLGPSLLTRFWAKPLSSVSRAPGPPERPQKARSHRHPLSAPDQVALDQGFPSVPCEQRNPLPQMVGEPLSEASPRGPVLSS